MSTSFAAASQANPPEASTAAAANSAVARCCDAYAQTFRLVAAVKDQAGNASYEAKEAYRRAMPPLDSPENIRDFIACVAYGMLINAFFTETASKLLYAAQIARGAQQDLRPRTLPAAARTPATPIPVPPVA